MPGKKLIVEDEIRTKDGWQKMPPEDDIVTKDIHQGPEDGSPEQVESDVSKYINGLNKAMQLKYQIDPRRSWVFWEAEAQKVLEELKGLDRKMTYTTPNDVEIREIDQTRKNLKERGILCCNMLESISMVMGGEDYGEDDG